MHHNAGGRSRGGGGRGNSSSPRLRGKAKEEQEEFCLAYSSKRKDKTGLFICLEERKVALLGASLAFSFTTFPDMLEHMLIILFLMMNFGRWMKENLVSR